MRLDGVRFTVVDMAPALAAYRTLLGVGSIGLAGGVERFQLERGAIELARGVPKAAVTFVTEAGDDLATWPTEPEEHGGLDVQVITAPAVAAPPVGSIDRICAIDHVVVSTNDPGRAIAHWRDRLGLRLAFDKSFPERGLRLMFFRSGGITFEFACPLEVPEDAQPDRVYGVSYRVRDVAACRDRLVEHGLDVGETHAGFKTGTTVTTVRSGTAGVPTLLIEDPARA